MKNEEIMLIAKNHVFSYTQLCMIAGAISYQKLTTEFLLEVADKIRSWGRDPADYEKMIIELRVVTGDLLPILEDKLVLIACDWWEIKNFYMATGRYPTPIEQNFLNQTSFDTWYTLYSSGIHIEKNNYE